MSPERTCEVSCSLVPDCDNLAYRRGNKHQQEYLL